MYRVELGRDAHQRCSTAQRWLRLMTIIGLCVFVVLPPLAQADSDSKSISISPEEIAAVDGATVSLTATVRYVEDNDLVANQRVLFVISGVHALKNGTASALTDSGGRAVFRYSGIHVGADSATAFLDQNNNSKYDPGEPYATAHVTWSAANLVMTPPNQTVVVGKDAQIKVELTDSTKTYVRLIYSVSGANPSAGVVSTTDIPSAEIDVPGTNAGVDTVTVFADYNDNDKQDPDEPTGTATITRIIKPTLALSPTNQNAAINSSATVKATLLSGITPVEGIQIHFLTSEAVYEPLVNPLKFGFETTDAHGEASFTYSGTDIREETVTAYADLNSNNEYDEDEPLTTVGINWTEPISVQPPTLPPADVLNATKRTTQQPGCDYFPATQHNLCGDISKYWTNFSAAILGYSITEPFQEDGRTVQYTERARIELHFDLEPMSADTPAVIASYADASPTILLGLLGNELTADRASEVPFQPATANPSPSCTFYAETGHNLCGGFRAYWQKYGGLSVYGFPISEEFQEVNPDTGKTFTVQYFERARYEWHPGEWPERYDVELGRLGAQAFALKYGTKYA